MSKSVSPSWKRFNLALLSSVTLALSVSSSAQSALQVVLPGTIQKALGAKEWDPGGDITRMVDVGGGLYQFTAAFPKGSYEYKVAVGGSWNENYGAEGKAGGDNLKLEVPADNTLVKFVWNSSTKVVADSINAPTVVKAPKLVILAGTIQKALGDKEWNPAGDITRMFEVGPDLYEFIAAFPKGDYEFKVAIGGSWTENYGAGGKAGGDNLKLSVNSDKTIVRFVYDDKTKVVKDSINNAADIKAPLNVPTQYIKVARAAGSLKESAAHWLSGDILAVPNRWAVAGAKFTLSSSAAATLKLEPGAVTGGQNFELTLEPAGLSAALKTKYPQLSGYAALKVPAAARAALKGQLAAWVQGSDGKLLDATGVQVYGVLDDLYASSDALGVVWSAGIPTLKLWAPTAQSVKLHLFDDAGSPELSVKDLTEKNGVWSVVGDSSWKGKYYYYELQVYAPTTQKLERNLVTDPYSLGLSLNSGRSRIVDLADPSNKPSGWDALKKPVLKNLMDLSFYELHIRDFSALDSSVPAAERGTYLAFTEAASSGVKHLKMLAQSGLKAVHLLPSFDIATIEEDKKKWKTPDLAALKKLPPDGEGQQALIEPTRDSDGFNWGYDPLHYTTPEGSYAVNPDNRTLEYRRMVQAINGLGLRVVQDVVYNHTSGAGQTENSILDKIVPGYYHRLNLEGGLESSTCCANTASEHAMMRKLMVDSILTWAKDYKVDGFRFDLMGHHMLADVKAVRASLDALTLEKDWVDGKKIYLYGEGWDFGEVAGNARGINASQKNLYGTGIGSFSDRQRDAVRGGGPFDEDQRTNQGYATGLYTLPNGLSVKNTDKASLERTQDLLMLGLAGNLRDFTFTASSGATLKGGGIDYNGQAAGYAASPLETITYISAHDNETLWDVIQMKAPRKATLEQRLRMNNLAVATVALGQGLPFFHAGDELLRSKSLDRNSYNSGDWFNKLDFTLKTNNWGVGLPPAGDNKNKWPWAKELLADPKLKATPKDISRASDHMMEMLSIRSSSNLFRLGSLEGVQKGVKFLQTKIPGLIVMTLEGAKTPENPYKRIVVAFNSSGADVSFASDAFKASSLKLHKVLQDSSDTTVKLSRVRDGSLFVPGLTTAVFVEE